MSLITLKDHVRRQQKAGGGMRAASKTVLTAPRVTNDHRRPKRGGGSAAGGNGRRTVVFVNFYYVFLVTALVALAWIVVSSLYAPLAAGPSTISTTTTTRRQQQDASFLGITPSMGDVEEATGAAGTPVIANPNLLVAKSPLSKSSSSTTSTTDAEDAAAAASATKTKTTTTVVQWTASNVEEMTEFTLFGKKEVCNVMDNVTTGTDPRFKSPSVKPLINITFSCRELFNNDFGTGNWVSALYALRQTALVSERIEVIISCSDAEEQKRRLIIPWITGRFRALRDINDGRRSTMFGRPLPTPADSCRGFRDFPLASMVPIIRQELRRMAVAALGVPGPNHPSAAFADKYMTGSSNRRAVTAGTMQLAASVDDPPLFPGVEIDEVALHFRCGDLIVSTQKSAGFIKYKGYADVIPKSATSIGIITQPFLNSKGQSRHRDDRVKSDICRVLVTDLVSYLGERFPTARIRVHNDADETILVAYARMIMADVAIAPISTFSVFPALSTFGTGYIRRPNYLFRASPNKFLNQIPLNDKTVVLFDTPRLMCKELVNLVKVHPRALEIKNAEGWETAHHWLLREWLRNDTFCLLRCDEKRHRKDVRQWYP